MESSIIYKLFIYYIIYKSNKSKKKNYFIIFKTNYFIIIHKKIFLEICFIFCYKIILFKRVITHLTNYVLLNL
jgi:hypothetical protein